jgi:phytol kinase
MAVLPLRPVPPARACMIAATLPWEAIGAVVVGAVAIIFVLNVLRHRYRLDAEMLRKAFHLGGGLVALSLPWFFDEIWPVLVLGLLLVGLLTVIRAHKRLNANVGQIIHAVDRQSEGEYWFILGVAATFCLAHDDFARYAAGILVLAVADTAAALGGLSYGLHAFPVFQGRKSVEGSGIFLLIAFLCVHIPILVGTDTGRVESLAMALGVAVLLALAEIAAARGSDNFFLPLLTVLLLDLFAGMALELLLVHLGVIILIAAFVYGLRRGTALSHDALVCAILCAFCFYILGGWHWLVPPVIVFCFYALLVHRLELPSGHPFEMPIFMAVSLPAIGLAIGYHLTAWNALFPPFVAAAVAVLALIDLLHRAVAEGDEGARPGLALPGIAKALMALALSWVVVPSLSSWDMLPIMLAILLAIVLFCLRGGALCADPSNYARWFIMPAMIASSITIVFGAKALFVAMSA